MTLPDGEAPAARVFANAQDLLRAASIRLLKEGSPGSYSQIYASDPLNAGSEVEIQSEKLSRDEARQVLRNRVGSGFSGLLGFSAMSSTESGGEKILVEMFLTLNGSSVVLSQPVKRGITGKYKIAGQPILHGDAEVLI
jgi:hypothetical protein